MSNYEIPSDYNRRTNVSSYRPKYAKIPVYSNDEPEAKNKITKEKIESLNPMSFGKYKDCSKMDISVIKHTAELHRRYHACNCTKQFFPSKKCKEINNKFKASLSNHEQDYIKIETKDIALGGKRKRRRKCTLKKRRNKKTQKRHQIKRKVGKSKKNQKKRY